MNQLDRIYGEMPSPRNYARAYLDYLSEVLAGIDEGTVATFIEILLKAREEGTRIFFIGNGGSAATASHFANDIGIGTRCFDKPFRALSLTDNQAIITAIANDDGYDEIFVQQLRTQLAEGDLVVAISASGNSPNVVNAIKYANSNAAYTIGLTGFDGGELAKIVRLNVHIPTAKGEYGPAEDGHMILDHLVGTYLARCVHAELVRSAV
jgi:D-sedoheptulose 7-phosphate isomerase